MSLTFEELRNKMVDEQLRARIIKSEAVLEAMRKVPRHLFVPEDLQKFSYDDSPLPIGFGQTISQPYIVAYMTEQLEPASGMKILEVGTGSGYQAAILAYLGCEIYTIELIEDLAARAKETLEDFGVFDAIEKVQGYEQNNFGEIITDLADPEKLVNMLYYIIGEEVLDSYQSIISDAWNDQISPDIADKLITAIRGDREVTQ